MYTTACSTDTQTYRQINYATLSVAMGCIYVMHAMLPKTVNSFLGNKLQIAKKNKVK